MAGTISKFPRIVEKSFNARVAVKKSNISNSDFLFRVRKEMLVAISWMNGAAYSKYLLIINSLSCLWKIPIPPCVHLGKFCSTD